MMERNPSMDECYFCHSPLGGCKCCFAKPAPTPDPRIGRGGAPTRATTFPDDAAGRKATPVATGVLDYFPDAIVAVAQVSAGGQTQHGHDELYWDRSKSADEADALARHFMQRGTFDNDGKRHSAKVAWRALAMLQKEIEEDHG